MMNPMQLMGMVQGSQNPMQLMQQMFGGNPLFNRAMQMGQGKSPEQLQQIVRNIAHTKGMSDNDLNNFLSQFNLRF